MRKLTGTKRAKIEIGQGGQMTDTTSREQQTMLTECPLCAHALDQPDANSARPGCPICGITFEPDGSVYIDDAWEPYGTPHAF